MSAARLRAGPIAHVLRLLPSVAAIACVAALAALAGRLDLGALPAQLSAFPARIWIAAAAFALLSHAALGLIEGVLHRIAGSPVAPARAVARGAQVAALAQTLGFGPLVGTLVRWRTMPELGPAGAARLAALSSAGFLGAGAGVLAVAVALASGQPALAAACVLLLGAAAARARPLAGLPGLSPGRVLALTGATVIDLAAAAAVLAQFLPAAALPDLWGFLALYLVALFAGLLTQGPAGIGAFDLAIIAALPSVPGETVAAALVGYRLIYHAAPATVAAAGLMVAPGRRRPAPLSPPGPTGLARALARAPSGDWGLVSQGARILLERDRAAGWLVRRAGRWLVALGPALGRADPAGLRATARAQGCLALLYKCDGRTARRARAAGWRVIPIAAEAILDTRGWSVDRPATRGLRRKLRAAAAAGLLAEVASGPLPHAEMAAVAAEWAARHGGERGFSMGRYCPTLTAAQLCILGRAGGQLQGFATFHLAGGKATLDLMRWRGDAPEGTMHSLVAAAIAEADRRGIGALSLSAVPAPGLRGAAGRALARRLGAPGLRQFKQAFDPVWCRRYACAPGWLALAAGLVAVAIAVRWPRALPVPLPHPLPAPFGEGVAAAIGPGLGVAPAPRPCEATSEPIVRRPTIRWRAPITGLTHDRRSLPPS